VERGTLDRVAIAAGVRGWRAGRFRGGAAAHFASAGAARRGGGVHPDRARHAGIDHPVPVVLRAGDLRSQVAANGGCDDCHDDL